METRTISEEQWLEYFDHFSRDHVGWPATIEVLDNQRGPLRVAQELPLQGISFDTKGTRPSTIQISVGDEPGTHVSHVIDLPLFIRQALEPDGAIDLQIEPANGPITLIHLHGPVQ